MLFNDIYLVFYYDCMVAFCQSVLLNREWSGWSSLQQCWRYCAACDRMMTVSVCVCVCVWFSMLWWELSMCCWRKLRILVWTLQWTVWLCVLHRRVVLLHTSDTMVQRYNDPMVPILHDVPTILHHQHLCSTLYIIPTYVFITLYSTTVIYIYSVCVFVFETAKNHKKVILPITSSPHRLRVNVLLNNITF